MVRQLQTLSLFKLKTRRINMKKLKTLTAAIMLGCLLFISTPMVAQTTDNTTTTTDVVDNDNNDDTGKWGLAGLLGLLGLLGLRRKDNDDHRRTTTTVNR